MAEGSTGFEVRPHVINVKTGENVSSKLMSFVQNSPTSVCILSAVGALSKVTLSHGPAISDRTATYEGWYGILSLSATFKVSDIGVQRRIKGKFSATFVGSDGLVIGGRVTGVLIAASPFQITVGSLVAAGRKEPISANHEASPAPLNANLGGMSGANSSPSRGTYRESSGRPGSLLNQNGPVWTSDNLQGISSMPWK